MTTAREHLGLGDAFKDEKTRVEFPGNEAARLQQLRLRCFEIVTAPQMKAGYVTGGDVERAEELFRWVTTGKLDKPTET